MQLVAFGTLAQMKGWFLLFALPQAMLPAALCCWKRVRPGRVFALLLALALALFYCAHMIYFRVFGSVISMSMVGVGGDAVENFGWALAVTLRESLGWLALFLLPVAAMLVWVFLPVREESGLRLAVRLAAIAAAVLLWLPAGALLSLGGRGDNSAYYAYTSAYVDTDTSAQRLGVLTTSVLELRSMLFGNSAESEMADAVSFARPTEQPLPAGDASDEAPLSPAAETDAQEDAAAPNILPEIDFAALAAQTDDETVKKLCEYFGAMPGTNRNDYTGLLEGYNLIYICAESFSTISLSEELTPTLCRMAREGIVLTNFYNSFKNTTTNGEFAMLTGLWPDLSRRADFGNTFGSFYQSAENYMPLSPGNIFRSQGVESYMFHNYLGSYYGRDQTHPNLGYRCRFSDTMKLSVLWPASDLEMMQQTVDDYIGDERFHAYYMTFSGHGPYDVEENRLVRRNLSRVPEEIDGRKVNLGSRCFFACALELEDAVAYLMERLEEEGKLDNTLIVIAGDHYPYFLSDSVARNILGELPEREFERFHSTCIMWCGALDKPIVCDTPCCNVDILPTVLNLLGLPYDSRLLSGTDIFSDGPHVAVLANKSFVSDTMKYNAMNGEVTMLDESALQDESARSAYLERINGDIMARYAAALAINRTDFYRFVWEKSGLMAAG